MCGVRTSVATSPGPESDCIFAAPSSKDGTRDGYGLSRVALSQVQRSNSRSQTCGREMADDLTRSVLVVEDDQIDTEYILRKLEELGIPYEVAARSFEAI